MFLRCSELCPAPPNPPNLVTRTVMPTLLVTAGSGAFSSLCTGAGFDKRFLRESQKPVESPKEFEFLESLMDYGNDGSHCHHLPL